MEEAVVDQSGVGNIYGQQGQDAIGNYSHRPERVGIDNCDVFDPGVFGRLDHFSHPGDDGVGVSFAPFHQFAGQLEAFPQHEGLPSG
jgi:hypothetical protein